MSKKNRLAVVLLSLILICAVGFAVLTGCKNKDGSIALDVTSVTLNVGEEQTLTVTKTDIKGELSYNWQSADTSVVTVKDGKITALKSGTTTVKVSAEDGKYTAECSVTVVAPTLELSTKALAIFEGKDATITAKVNGKNNVEMSGIQFAWTLKEGDSVTIAPNGGSVKVAASKVGVAKIGVVATVNADVKLSETITVSVGAKYSVSVVQSSGLAPVSGGYELKLAHEYDKDDVRKEWTINGVSVLAYGEVQEGAVLTYGSSDSAVAAVENGKIVAKGAGNCVVTGTYADNDGKSVSIVINVKVDDMFKQANIVNNSQNLVTLTGLADKYYDGQKVTFTVSPKTAGAAVYAVTVNGTVVQPNNENVYETVYSDGMVITADTEIGLGFEISKATFDSLKTEGQNGKDHWLWMQFNDSTIAQIYNNNNSVSIKLLNKDWANLLGNVEKWGDVEGDNLYVYLRRTVSEQGTVVWSVYVSGSKQINVSTSMHLTADTKLNSLQNPYVSVDFKSFKDGLQKCDEIVFDRTAVEYSASSSGQHATVTGLKDKYAYGEKATFTVTPEAGYEILNVKVGSVELTADNEGKYTYQPSADFEVVVTARLIPTERNVTVVANGATVTDKDGNAIAQTVNNGSTLEFKVIPREGGNVYYVKVNGQTVTPISGVYSVTVEADVQIVCGTETMGVISLKAPVAQMRNGWQGMYICDGAEASEKTYLNVHFETGSRSLGLQICRNSPWGTLGEKWSVLTGLTDEDNVYIYVYRTVSNDGKLEYTVYASKTAAVNVFTTPYLKVTTDISAEGSEYLRYEVNNNEPLTATDVEIAFDMSKPVYNSTHSADNATIDGLAISYQWGDMATFTVNPADGYEIVSVKIGNDTLEKNADGKYVYEVYCDFQVVVTTREIPTEREISVTANNATVTDESGAILANTIIDGGTLKFKAAAKDGHELYFVKVNGTILEPVDGVYTVENVTQDVTIVCETDIGFGFKTTYQTLKDLGKGNDIYMNIKDGASTTVFRAVLDGSKFIGLQFTNSSWNKWDENKKFSYTGDIYIYLYRTLNAEKKVCWTAYASDSANMNFYTTGHIEQKNSIEYSGRENSFSNFEMEDFGNSLQQINISFDMVKPTYTASSSGDNAVVSGLAQSYEYGETATFTVTAETGYEIVSVKIGDATLTATDGNYSHTVYGNFQVVVETREIPAARAIILTVNNAIITAEDGSTLSSTVANGETLKFKAVAKDGHELYFVKVNGAIVEPVEGVYSVTVDSDVNIVCETDIAFGFATTQTKLEAARGSDPWNWMYPNDKTVLGILYNGADSGNNFGIQISNNWNNGQSSYTRIETEDVYVYIRRTVDADKKIVWSVYISSSKNIDLTNTYHLSYTTDKNAVDNPYSSINYGNFANVLTTDSEVTHIVATEPELVDTIAFTYQQGVKSEGDPWRNF